MYGTKGSVPFVFLATPVFQHFFVFARSENDEAIQRYGDDVWIVTLFAQSLKARNDGME
jgi:hypothetical protein